MNELRDTHASVEMTGQEIDSEEIEFTHRISPYGRDDGARICEYNIDRTGLMYQAKWNETFDGTGKLIQWCQTDYVYDSYGADDPQTHGWLDEIKNTYHHINQDQTESISVLTQNDYQYNKAGMRLTNQISNSGGVVRTEIYGYDNLYRLNTVNYGDGETQTYSFDSMGNRLQKTDNNLTENYTYNAANMLLTRGTNSYTNDANGNTLTGGGRTNTWDSQNRLTQCVYNGTTSQFTYASDGLRHRNVATTGSNVTTTDSVLDGSMMVQEVASTNGGAQSTATYLIGPRGSEYRKDANGVKWYSYDGLGSVLGEVDLNGNLTATRSYDVYGAKRTSGGTQSTNHGFVGSLGHPSEDSTGMIYMRARYVDPAVGRFVSEDSKQSGTNWYLYANSDPINTIDRTGYENSGVGFNVYVFFFDLMSTTAIGRNRILRNVLECFVGIPVEDQYVKRLEKYLHDNMDWLTGPAGMIGLVNAVKWKLPSITMGNTIIRAFGAMIVNDWVAIVGCEMAFEEGR